MSLIQGGYFFLTGVWPLVDIESFQWVTGPKTDLWLVRTVGLLIAVVGGVLLLAGYRRSDTAEVRLLAIASAAALTFIDVFYVSIDVISPIYLLDAAGEVVLIAGWAVAIARAGKN